MKKLLLGIMLAAAFGLGGAAAVPTVVATHAVFGEFAQAVGGDLINVVTIIPSGFCPAHYDLRPSDVRAVADASLLIYSGFEPWMDTLRSALGSSAKVVQLKGDWNTPDGAAEKVDAIAAALSELLPDAQDALAANAAAYKARLAQIATELKKRADELGTASIPVICMQWQVPFVSWLGFDIVATYGVPEGLSMQDLVRLARVGKENRVRLVIDNLQSGIDFGAKLAQEVGAVHVVLSNFPGAMPHTATVLDLFVRNADSLFSAIAPIPGE
ncbi:zinc ABC transporter substrate-binding protein [Candidatus Bipolaricaulota bacterium]|nr:zinc ABC transporter substrate-binding protein [Candidatus Bipolaricaulota bacterium]